MTVPATDSLGSHVLNTWRSAVQHARVLVVGDVMLDRYWFGDVDRISPEAPVPVVRVRDRDERLGGAANVARNIRSLGATVSLLGVVGDDEAGVEVRRLLADAGIHDKLTVDAASPTIVKLRVLGRGQQLVRIDFEQPPSHEVLADKLDVFRQALVDHDIVVLSDYGKGGLTHITAMIEAAKAEGRTVLIDPKGDDYARYRGADILTPNRSELRQVVGAWASEADLAQRAEALRSRLGLQRLLLTRSEEGMTLFDPQGNFHMPAQAREVFDVSGAGDTVIGTLAAMLAAGADIRTAVTLANKAGGIVVGKLGTATVTPDELFV